jgi:hypothetical protein
MGKAEGFTNDSFESIPFMCFSKFFCYRDPVTAFLRRELGMIDDNPLAIMGLGVRP